MGNLQLLDQILLSDNVVEEFYNNYSNAEFKAWLTELLPEVDACQNLKQDNPWHIYNCLEHILHSVEEINKQTLALPHHTQKMLAYTMFYHDLGKPACYIRRYSKLYGREVDSFFNHNKASVNIAKRTLKQFGFDDHTCQIIEQLIDKHDIFMFITLHDDHNPHHQVLTPTLLKNEIASFNKIGNGKELMKYLIMVGRADNLAQNPKMTKQPLQLLDAMQTMLNNLN